MPLSGLWAWFERRLPRAVLDARLRSEYLTRLLHGRTQVQGSTFTLPDRYPVLFAECRRLLADFPSPKVLSFGCSTGEEVFSLARWLPDAEITGVEVNRWCLRVCRRRVTSERVRFLHPASPDFAHLQGCDAIFCMAVLQRTRNQTEGRQVAQAGFGFADFERSLDLLDQKLKLGGLLFLDHCDFSFADTAIYTRYEELSFPNNRRLRKRALFGPDNRLKTTGYIAARGYRKLR